jgi:hypothetical protein
MLVYEKIGLGEKYFTKIPLDMDKARNAVRWLYEHDFSLFIPNPKGVPSVLPMLDPDKISQEYTYKFIEDRSISTFGPVESLTTKVISHLDNKVSSKSTMIYVVEGGWPKPCYFLAGTNLR